LSLPKLHLS